jgi:hypothetical protein
MSIKERIFRKHRSYRDAFSTDAGKVVLKDLKDFCGADKPCFSKEPLEMAYREGRREVYLRIMAHIDLTKEQLRQLNEME